MGTIITTLPSHFFWHMSHSSSLVLTLKSHSSEIYERGSQRGRWNWGEGHEQPRLKLTVTTISEDGEQGRPLCCTLQLTWFWRRCHELGIKRVTYRQTEGSEGSWHSSWGCRGAAAKVYWYLLWGGGVCDTWILMDNVICGHSFIKSYLINVAILYDEFLLFVRCSFLFS